jgi:hypothetical protein
VTIIYAVLESPHRWAILAGISATAGLVGAMAIIAWDWSLWFARIWILTGLALAVYCLVRLLLQWKAQIDEAASDGARNTRIEAQPSQAPASRDQ